MHLRKPRFLIISMALAACVTMDACFLNGTDKNGRDLSDAAPPTVSDNFLGEAADNNTGGTNMDFDYDSVLGIDALGLYYEAHVAGFDGEDIIYNVYFDDELTEEKYEETEKAISDFRDSFGEDTYPGFIDVANAQDKALIHLDLGNTEPETGFRSMQGILKALNNVSGISQVILNEDLQGFDF